VNTKLELELEAYLQPQTCLPAQNSQDGGGEQIETEPERWAIQTSRVEQFRGEQGGERQVSVSDRGEQTGGVVASDSSPNNGEHTDCQWGEQARGEQRRRYFQTDKRSQSDPSSQWLKNILPSASNGWWDVRIKGERFTVKFRWRDPDLQVITLLRLHKNELEALRQSDHENAQHNIREQVLTNLHTLLLDQSKRDKALIAAEKLGIDGDILL
jgi:hypothetical protein